MYNSHETRKHTDDTRKHGTFRPTLMNLVKQNSTDTVQETTRSAFSEPDPMKAVKTLTALRGIGPATASLLLSVRQPNTVPFFSDELFRWSQWDVVGKKGAGDGWDRKIKYNVGEYKALLESVGVLRERLGVWAVDAEKVAYVLGKEMANINGDGDGEVKVEPVKEEVDKKEKSGDAQEESAKRVQEALAEIRGEKARGVNGSEKEQKAKSEGSEKMAEDEKKSGTKRKAKEGIVPAEATRRSARRKT